MGQPTTDPATQPPAPTGEPPKPADPPKDPDKGAGGKEAILADLAKEREARKELQKQIESLAPLKDLAAAIGVKPDQGKTDVQTLTDQIKQLQDAQAASELRALRLEVAAEKGLTPAQAARLQGGTRDELAADADALKALFPGGTSATPGTPAPDPSQGARGGTNDLEAALKAAQEKGDTRAAIRLKTQIAALKTTT